MASTSLYLTQTGVRRSLEEISEQKGRRKKAVAVSLIMAHFAVIGWSGRPLSCFLMILTNPVKFKMLKDSKYLHCLPFCRNRNEDNISGRNDDKQTCEVRHMHVEWKKTRGYLGGPRRRGHADLRV